MEHGAECEQNLFTGSLGILLSEEPFGEKDWRGDCQIKTILALFDNV